MNDAVEPGPRYKIMVVDDDPASLYATSRILRAAGFDVVEASTGGTALEVADQHIDLVVLDINLPDIDGLEVCRRLRARSDTAYLPIVHLTATYVADRDLERGLRAGGDSYLTHPVDPPVLTATVRTLLFARDAEKLRRETDARFRTIFELASSGIALLDANLVYVDVNPEFCRVAGRERGDIIGRSCKELIMPGHEATCAQLQAALAQDRRWSGMVPVRRPDGTIADVEWRVVAESDQGARIAIAANVTERERLLASERAARAEAERANRLKDEFLATLSHELRNPLSAMLGWAKVLRRKDLSAAMLEQGLDAIERNSRVQNHLIGDLLDLAGIRFGKMRMDMDTIAPARAIEAAAEVVSAQAQGKGVELQLHLTGRDCHVFADESRLQQVVWNLLSNAIKFTAAGGRIDVHAGPVGGQYQIAVADTGRGIDPQFLPQIFERFSQQESGAGKSFAGLGIGLTIVKHLVDIHHGSIQVESAGIDRGTTFRVLLPLTERRHSETPGQRVHLEGVRVLVVEDDPDARALVTRLLHDAGAIVTGAENAEAAMRQVRDAMPDVMVSDIGMAQQDGYQLVRNLRAAGLDAQRLPAIALTAFTRPEDRADALEAGFQAHIPKPVSAEALVAAVANLTRRRAPESTA